MAENLGEIFVKIRADIAELETEIKQLKGKLDKDAEKIGNSFSNTFKKAFVAAGGIIAFKKLLDFGLEAKNIARDAEEIRSKFNTVFSSLQSDANKLADNFAKNFGIAGTTARELLGQTGNLLVGFGFTEQQALALSKQVNELAQDLTSFTNFSGGAKGASDALTKALLGETEMAKSLGIVIRQNSDEFLAEIKSLMQTNGMTENQARAIAVLNEAYRQSGKAIGDYARTKYSLANTERRLNEMYKDMEEQIGNGLTPVFKTLIQLISELSINMGDSAGSISAFGAAAKGVATPLIIIITLLKQAANIIGTVGAGLAHLITGSFIKAAKSISIGWEMALKDSETMNTALYNMWSNTSKKINQLNMSPSISATGARSGHIINIDLLEKEAELYNELYYGSARWYNKSIELIKAQTKEMINKGINRADAFTYEKKKLDELNASYERLQITLEFLNKSSYKPKFNIPKELKSVELPEKPESQQSEMQKYYDLLNEGGPFAGENGFVNAVETSMATASGFVDGFFEDIRISSENANSLLEKGFVEMANAFIAQVQRMIAQWLAFQTIRGVFSLFGIPFGAEGGTFVSTNRGVKKMAGGGSFIVPPGYSNDSYPMFVQTGERVTVTPANRVGEQERLLSNLIKRMDIMNLYLIENSLRENNQRIAVDIYGKLQGKDIWLLNKRINKVQTRLT